MDAALRRKWTAAGLRRIWGAAALLLFITAALMWFLRQPPPVTANAAVPLPRVNRLCFSPERGTRYLAAALSDGRVRLWDTTTRGELPVKLRSQWPLNDLAWASDGLTLFVGGFEEHVLTWNVKTNRSSTLKKFAAPVVSVALRPQRPELLVSLANGELWWLDLSAAEREIVKSGHTGIVKMVRYHPDGKSFVTGGADQQLVWHDAVTRAVSQTVAAHQHEIGSLAFSRDGTQLVTGSWDNTARVWQAGLTEPVATLTHPDGVATVAWRASDIVTTCWDGRLRIWNVTSGQVIREQPCRSDSLACDIWPGRSGIAEVSTSGDLLLDPP